MATYDDIRLQKGSIDITLFTELATENLKNNVQIIPPVQVAQNQASGSKIPKILDMLKITETYVFKCAITKDGLDSAQDVKSDLNTLAKGAGIDGAEPITLTYEDTAFTGYITDLVIKRHNSDNAAANYNGDDSKEYDVTLTFTIGEAVA